MHVFRACYREVKGKQIIWEQTNGEKTKQKTNKWDDIGQMLVPGALTYTDTIRKAGADIFASSGLEKS